MKLFGKVECFDRRSLKGYQCVYCGITATVKDHFPPISYCYGGWLLPACKECNNLAGTDWPLNFKLRIYHVKDKLRIRYRDLLSTPDWDDEEINELGYNLQSGIKIWMKKKRFIQERLAWNAIAYLSLIDVRNDFVNWLVEIDTTTKSVKEIFKSLEN